MGESEEEIAGIFRNYAEINLGAFCQKCRKQFFDQEVHAEIGKAMNYPFALLMLQRAFRVEDEVNVNWVPTYDEAVEDLECAFFLCANCFYKQGLQILRNVIELSVVHAYFHLDEDAFEQWQNDPGYRLPYVRGNGGMLCKLRRADWIDDRVYESGYDLYGRLNKCVHASPARMGSRRGEMDVEKLTEFCTVSSEVGEFVINLTLHLTVNWNSQPIDTEGITDIRF